MTKGQEVMRLYRFSKDRLLAVAVIAFAFSPKVLFAAGLIKCGTERTAGGGAVTNPCGFDDLIILAQDVINFLIFSIAAPLAAVMFAYAGFLYVTNRGNESQIKRAHTIFLSVFWGFVVVLGAYLIIYFIINFFLKPEFMLLEEPS
jgi:hypothetical protein